jgi:quercetin dioxygenase-like cupin family protein
MRSKFWAAALLCLAATAVLPEEATKIDPQHYKLGFENDEVRVVYIHYGPHEKSVMHEHPRGVVVYVSDGHLRFIDQTGKVQEVYAKHGESRWFPAFKHKVENLDDKSFDGVYIGMKH